MSNSPKTAPRSQSETRPSQPRDVSLGPCPILQPGRPRPQPADAAALGILVVATIAAFFFTQVLKVSLPLVAGDPMPSPSTIDPVSGHSCWAVGPRGKRERVSYRYTRFSFYLQYRADYVDVDVISRSGRIIRTVAARRYMRTNSRYPDGSFWWNGREDDGTIASASTSRNPSARTGSAQISRFASQAGPTCSPMTTDFGLDALLTSTSGAQVRAGEHRSSARSSGCGHYGSSPWQASDLPREPAPRGMKLLV